jgi:hypothetical protein
MRGPFGLVIAAGLALLVVAIFFSLAPTVGGSIDNGNPILGRITAVALLNDTPVAIGTRNIGNVLVSNASTLEMPLRYGTDYSYVSDVGSITLLKVNPNFNGTYYVQYDSSMWAGTVNTGLTEGGTWFSDNATWVTLTFLGIVAGIIIAMFMRW